MSDDLISRQAVIDAVHHAVFEFFDICEDDEESPMTEKDKMLLSLNKAISTRIQTIPSAEPTIYTVGLPDAEEVERLKEILLKQQTVTIIPEPQRWIPVTERKPDDGHRVIVTDFGYVEVSRWFDGRWYDIDGNTLKGVTAWMPLPEPWKGEV